MSVVYAVLLKPLPYSNPQQIYSVQVAIPERRSQFASLPVRVQAYLEWRRAETAFAEIAALRPWECNLTGDGEPERLGGARVSTNFFAFLGVPIAQGRGFRPEEEESGKEKVVVISNSLWRRRYASDPGLVGRSVNGEKHLVVESRRLHFLFRPGQCSTRLYPSHPESMSGSRSRQFRRS